MLIANSTPRMRYRIGMRAWLEAVEDKSLPSLVADAGGEVAADFKVSIEFYRGMSGMERWALGLGVTKVPKETCRTAAGLSSRAFGLDGCGGQEPRDCRRGRQSYLVLEFLQITPADQDYMIVFYCFL
jgi:hypothetical protein